VGSLRLLLAVCVLLSHAGVSILGWNPGVVAVISFFILSGYVMTLLIRRHYASPDRIVDFYLDRAARLFPQFLFYCLATAVLITNAEVDSQFLRGCDAYKLALNLAILPLDFFPGLESCMLIPQAWSLGLEMFFYLVVPLVFLLPREVTRLVVGGSIGVFLAAYLGIIDTDLYGYRLLPGVLFMFLVGAAHANGELLGENFPRTIWVGAVVLFITLLLVRSLFVLPYSKEVLLGLIIGIPVLGLVTKLRFSSLDEFLGNLSYGIFLNHFLCIWLLQSLFGLEIGRIRHVLLLLAMSAAMAFASYYLVERPALGWRRAVRYRPVQSNPLSH